MLTACCCFSSKDFVYHRSVPGVIIVIYVAHDLRKWWIIEPVLIDLDINRIFFSQHVNSFLGKDISLIMG